MKILAWTAIPVIILILGAAMFTFTVDETDYVVLTRFGKPIEEPLEPGLHFRLPYPIDRVNRIDRRVKIYQGRLMEFLTKDKKNIVVQCYITWQVKDPLTFFASVGSVALAEEKLEDILTSKGGAAVGDFDFDNLISVTNEIMISDMEERIQEQIGKAAQKYFGVEILDTGISRLTLPEANEYAVYDRMRAERKAIANKYRAEGEEKASGIRAEADKEMSDIVSTAYQNAQIIKGEGEAEAARIYAEAFSEDPEFYQFWRTLETYRKILDEKTTLVLTEDSELFKYLRQ